MPEQIAVYAGVKGIYELQRGIAHLRKGVQTKLMRSAVTAACKPVLSAMIAYAPEVKDPRFTVKGVLRRSMRKRIKKSKKYGQVMGVVGPVSMNVIVGMKGTRPIIENPAKIAHLVEYDHGGPGAAGEHPFARKAWAQTQQLSASEAHNAALWGLYKLAREARTK